MSWIITYSGKRVFPLDFKEEHVSLVDIAHALSLKCRFNGQCNQFYSVAEHSFRCTELPHVQGLSYKKQLGVLLHDAAEAYLPDYCGPIKNKACFVVGDCSAVPADFCEELILKIVFKELGASWPPSRAMRSADLIMLNTEARDLGMRPELWCNNRDFPPLDEKIYPWSPDKAEEFFLDRYEFLKQKAEEIED